MRFRNQLSDLLGQDLKKWLRVNTYFLNDRNESTNLVRQLFLFLRALSMHHSRRGCRAPHGPLLWPHWSHRPLHPGEGLHPLTLRRRRLRRRLLLLLLRRPRRRQRLAVRQRHHLRARPGAHARARGGRARLHAPRRRLRRPRSPVTRRWRSSGPDVLRGTLLLLLGRRSRGHPRA